MSIVKERLFVYTRSNELLVGCEVTEANKVKKIIRTLQKEKKMDQDWKLDIFCRKGNSVKNIIIDRVDLISAARIYGNYSISIVIDTGIIKPYKLSVAYFNSRLEAKNKLYVVGAYLKHRYGINYKTGGVK